MKSTWVLAWMPSVAWVDPSHVVHSGRALDVAGTPIEGSRAVTIELVNDADMVRWTEPHTVPFEDGFYAVTLGTNTALSPALLAEDLDVVVRIGTTALSRQPLTAVPHALAVDGLVRVSAAPTSCGGNAGMLRMVSGNREYCDGTDWRELAVRSIGIDAVGGTVTTGAGVRVHTFTSSGSFTVGPNGGTVEVEVLGGGGGGGTGSSDWGTGGGGGGYVKASVDVVASQTYTVTVGGAGAAQTSCNNALTGGNGGPPRSPASSRPTGDKAAGRTSNPRREARTPRRAGS
jgi:hypothetical protein